MKNKDLIDKNYKVTATAPKPAIIVECHHCGQKYTLKKGYGSAAPAIHHLKSRHVITPGPEQEELSVLLSEPGSEAQPPHSLIGHLFASAEFNQRQLVFATSENAFVTRRLLGLVEQFIVARGDGAVTDSPGTGRTEPMSTTRPAES